jgi:hypothetical protein
VLLIAAFVDQARLAFDYICRDLRSSPVLLAKVRKFRKNEIVLRNNVTIICCPCSSVSIRGKNVITAVCDEVCFWRNEETAAHSDVEVLAALRPSMITFPNAKLIKVTTPHAKRGVVWDEFRRRGELDYPVFQIPTVEMNPTVSPEMLKHERDRNLEQYNREYRAEFVEDVVSWIDPEVLDPCIVPGRTELPRVNNGTYIAAVDPAFKQSDFALAIAHRTSEGLIVLDRVDRWAGTTKAPLAFGRVCREVADILRRYQIDHLQGDQYAAAAIQQEFLKLGIHYREVTFGRQTRPQLFNNLKHLLTQRQIELLDQPELLRQLRALEESRAHDGGIDVQAGYGNDDLACVLGLCAFELSQNQPLPSPIILARASRSWDARYASIIGERGGYLVGSTCSKYPNCFQREQRCECYE